MQFLKDNWLWVAVPILLFALVVVAVVLLGPETQDPNGYHLR